jgi:hypothetical protein
MIGLSLLLIPFMAMAAFQVSSAKAQIPYRLLKVVRPSDPENGANKALHYFISVQNFLDKSAVEGLICEVIEKEKPAQGQEFGIAIYQGLETISTLDLVFGREVDKHDTAIYVWSPGHSWLSILRDPWGMRLTPIKSYEFDHVQSCPNR